MYHYVYKLYEKETGKYYIGSRSCKCIPELDNYFGSMKTWKPINKYKLEKIILKQNFLNRNDANKYECEQIRKNINNILNQNYNIPGERFHTFGMVVVKDIDGNTSLVSIKDTRFLNGELIAFSKNTVTVKDIDGNTFSVSIDDPRYLSGELVHIFTNTVTVRDKYGNIFHVNKNDSNYISGEYESINKNKILVKDINDNTYLVSIDNPRYLSGELKSISCGKVVVKDIDGNTFSVSIDDPRYLSGELVHISTGIIVVKDKDGNTFSVDKNDPKYLSGELVGNRKNILHNEETKKKISNSLIGEKNPFFGKKHSLETINKINETKLKNKLSGKTKSWVWIYNIELQISKKIIKGTELPKNWKYGRFKRKKLI